MNQKVWRFNGWRDTALRLVKRRAAVAELLQGRETLQRAASALTCIGVWRQVGLCLRLYS